MNNCLMEMPQATKDAWIAALRSGKYKQTRIGQLEYKGAYCCLGVLELVCENEVETNICGSPKGMPSDNFYNRNKIELLDDDTKFAQYNDGSHYSFKKIADIVEKRVKGV